MARVHSNGIEVEYETFGSRAAPPMILIQGLGAQMVAWRRELCEALAKAGYFVIRFDNRDVGRSTWCRDVRYTLGDMADDAAGLLAALGIADAHVVGQSLGGMIAQQLAIRRPNALRSLCLVYSMPDARYLLSDADWLEDYNRPPARTKAEAVEEYVQDQRWAASRDYPFDEGWIRELGALTWDRGYNTDGFHRQVAAAEATEWPHGERVPASVPTLLLHGDADQLIDVAASHELAQLIPHATLRIFPGVGHELPRPLWPELVAAITANATNGDTITQSRAIA
jgi:pimeloyl-ACP methyl ester carboxylesterase